PFIGLWWAGRNASRIRIFWYWCLTLGLSSIIMVGVGMLNGYGLDWVRVIAGTGSIWSFWSPIGAGAELLRVAVVELGFGNGEWVMPTIRLAGRLLSVVIVLLLMF